MGGSSRDSPPGTAAARRLPTETLELVNADLDPPPPHVDELGLAPGTVLADKYLVEREIGRGGIGVIVAARHLQLDQHVAIKYLQKHVLGNKPIVDRFAREARLAAKIRSDHVVRVHDVASHPSLGPYMVMEYLEGNDLGRFVEAGPLPIAQAIDYVLQACDALAEAHALGIVHRDLKPDNLFLAKRAAGASIVKILDFGISKAAPTQRGVAAGAHVTTESEAFGTPVYMSPEQLRSSASVDARSDIWALGVVLFELLTTHLPFNGDSIPQLCTSILEDAPRPLRSLRPHSPPELEAAIQRCLEKDPARRFRNVGELAQELERFGPRGVDVRVRHIMSVVREGGFSVRPPTPMPGTYSIGEARAVIEAATVNVPALPPTVLDTPDESSRIVPSTRRRAPVIFAGAAGVALIAIVGLMAGIGRSSSTATPTTSATTSTIATTTATTPPSSTASASATPPPSDTASASEPATSAVTSVPTAKPKPPPPPTPAVAPGVSAALPAKPAAKPVKKDDYSQFGGRP